MSGVTYRSMYWWASGELDRLRLREQRYPDDEGVRLAAVRAEAVLKLIGWCEDHAEDIKAIAARDKAKQQQMSRRKAAAPRPRRAENDDEIEETEPSLATRD